MRPLLLKIILLSVIILTGLSAFSQKKLAVTRIRNNHSYYFTEGKKIICKTYNEDDSLFTRHQGILTILSDTLIKLDDDTLTLSDITSIKKYYSTGGKIALSCLLMYFPVSALISYPLGLGVNYWAIAQGIDETYAAIAAAGVVIGGSYAINYIMLSNSTMFRAYGRIGEKFRLSVIQ